MITKRIKALRLSRADSIHLAKSSKAIERVEQKYVKALDQLLNQHSAKVIRDLKQGRKPSIKIDFLKLYMEHYFESAMAGIKSAGSVPKSTLASPRTIQNATIDELREEMRLWRQSRIADKDVKKYVADIEKQYRKKIQDVVRKFTDDIEAGGIRKTRALESIKRRLQTGPANAKTTIVTETTRYYTERKRRIYDQADSITHYLFVPIRDSRTTKWCKTRDRVVYKKGSKYLEKETPPIHWNCRSDILPLSPFNPVHRRLINDRSKARENRKPAPLPPGWS